MKKNFLSDINIDCLRDFLKWYNQQNGIIKFCERLKRVFCLGQVPDWYKFTLELQIENHILRERLFNCKNDNNKLKKQYLDVIRHLTRDVDGKELNIRRVTDINWDLDKYLSVQLISYLTNFKKHNMNIPSPIYQECKVEDNCDEQLAKKIWNNYLDKMILAFTYIKNDLDAELTEEQKQAKKEGLQLFVDYFEHLWL